MLTTMTMRFRLVSPMECRRLECSSVLPEVSMEIAQPRRALVSCGRASTLVGSSLSFGDMKSYDQILNSAKLLLPESHD